MHHSNINPKSESLIADGTVIPAHRWRSTPTASST